MFKITQIKLLDETKELSTIETALYRADITPMPGRYYLRGVRRNNSASLILYRTPNNGNPPVVLSISTSTDTLPSVGLPKNMLDQIVEGLSNGGTTLCFHPRYSPSKIFKQYMASRKALIKKYYNLNGNLEDWLYNRNPEITLDQKLESETSQTVAKSKYTTLSPDQEKELFLRYDMARIFLIKELLRSPKRTQRIKRWTEIVMAYQNHLVESNIPLVFSMLDKWKILYGTRDEYISEGNSAVMRSAQSFDITQGYKFSTYACRAIIKAFARVAEKENKYNKRFPVSYNPAFEKVKNRSSEEQKEYALECLQKAIQRADLIDNEKEVLRHRFPLDGSKRPTLVQVGEMMSLTKERIRQIQEKALGKLRISLDTFL